MDAPFAVEAENIFFSYASELPVLRGLSMRVERGCFACVLGHSGCGKSTLLNLVMGLSRPSSGVVKINGAEAEGPGTDRAIVFQDCSLFPWMTAQENVAFAIRHARKITKQASAALAADFLSQVGLYESRGKYPNQLSVTLGERILFMNGGVISGDFKVPFGYPRVPEEIAGTQEYFSLVSRLAERFCDAGRAEEARQ